MSLFKLLFPGKTKRELEFALSRSESNCKALQLERNLLKNRRDYLNGKVDDLTGENEFLHQRIEELNEDVARISDNTREQCEKACKLEQENEYLTNEKLDLQADIDDAITEKHALEIENSHLQSQLDDLRMELLARERGV